MSNNNGLKLRFTITCKKCGKSWECRTENPKECIYCRSRSWFKEPTEPIVVHVPLPKVDHSTPLPLKEGGHCPYESQKNSHTIVMNSDASEIRYYCASCDATWTRAGDYLGVVLGIGAKR